jgi:hypothetical protein
MCDHQARIPVADAGEPAQIRHTPMSRMGPEAGTLPLQRAGGSSGKLV